MDENKMKKTRPKVDRFGFEKDLLKLLKKYKLCKKGDLIQRVKIIIGLGKAPFIEIDRHLI